MYVNTEKLLGVLEYELPKTDKTTKAQFVFDKIGLKAPTTIDFYKFKSGRVVSISAKSGDKLFRYLTQLAAKGVSFSVGNIIGMTSFGQQVLRKPEVLEALKSAKKSNNKAKKEDKDIKEGEVEKSSREILSEVLTELKDMNKTLKHIATTQDETCHFIRTLVYALNGEPKK